MGGGTPVSCRMGFLSGSVSARRGDAISFKASCSMEPCRPTMESSVTQSAAGQRAPSPYQRAGICSSCSNGFNGGEVAAGRREELGGGGVKQGLCGLQELKS